MAVPPKPGAEPKHYLVLRAIRMRDEHIEAGSVIAIDSKPLATELMAAGKIEPTDKAPKLVKPRALAAPKKDAPAKDAEAADGASEAPAADSAEAPAQA